MQPLKLVIPGQYWDCQMYRGRLYLFKRSGEYLVVDWDSFIESIPVATREQLALRCAFARGDYLYGDHWHDVFGDDEFRELLIQKFRVLAESEIDTRSLEDHIVGRRAIATPFPHIDSVIYGNKLYIAAQAGVVSAGVGAGLKHGISTVIRKHTDLPTTGISASYGTLALAAGSEGLFQSAIETIGTWTHNQVSQLSNLHCGRCAWNYYSICASSLVSKGYLADFRMSREARFDEEDRREFEGVRLSRQLFGHDGYAWGAHDKLYQVRGQMIQTIRYMPWADEAKGQHRFEELGAVHIDPLKGQFLGAKVAVFGVVMEFEQAIAVLQSDGAVYNICVEPVVWRVFPYSRRYENHLHVITDDALEIYSFNHDYFVNQEDKRIGSRWRVSR